ncbi:hypothetical protein BASA81_003184 [Batrachochytrium salamandrivorans]|nr:hypothetical protein BASA81_003184 [Batrachochytrium salamandrivorans]
MIAVVSLGLPSQSKTVTSSSSKSATKRTDNSISSVKETLCVYDCLTGTKLGSHRMEGGITAGLTADVARGIFTSRQNKATTAAFAFGKEQPSMRFAAPEPLEAIQFSSDAMYIVAGGLGNGMVYLWETETGQMLAAFKAHYRKVTCLAFTEDDTVLVTGGEDAMVHFWDFTSLVLHGSLGGNSSSSLLRTVSTCKTAISQVSMLGLAGTTSSLAIASLDHTVRVVQLHNGNQVFAATLPTSLLSVCLDMDNVYAGGSNGSVYLVKDFATSASANHVLTGHDGPVTCLRKIKPTELVSGSEDGTLRWWDTVTFAQLRMSKMEGACPVRGLVVLFDSDYVNDLVKRKRRDTQPLKKVKEAEQWDRPALLTNFESKPMVCFWE